MEDAVVVDCCRTAIGRAHPERGYFRQVRSDDLAAACVTALLERSGLDRALVDDVVMGNTQQTLEQGLNVARVIGLISGLPASCGGTTVNRLCGSSLQALNQAAHAIMAGMADVQIAGGLEHMHHIPMDHGLDVNPRLYRYTSRGALLMGVTAEFLAQTRGISRREQDEFALRSHQRADAAHRQGLFKREIVPVWGLDEQGSPLLVTRDQCIRPDTSIEALAALPPVFMPQGGTITAGNSSPLNDGAAALLVMSRSTAKRLGLKPLVRIRATAVAGVDPCVMGLGPVPATRKALERAKLSVHDLDLVEINEAFAAQTLACIRELGLPEEKVNVRGGAIAIGHPLGASGARIATTLIHAMVDQGATFGLATMCIGLGQGIATIFERVES
ncbi:MAG: 3-ketoacyl-CoA thiolase [Pirellulaceae bacterium]|nr:MAG: 3-ketoacyl-CoA thiolase [Pirellulaceae bacterium]